MSKYAVVDNAVSTIVLTDRAYSHPMWDTVFCEFKISKDKTIISGLTLDYTFELDKVTPLFLVDDKHVIDRKFLWWHWKTYKKGWVLLKKRKFLKITNPKGFIVIEGDL